MAAHSEGGIEIGVAGGVDYADHEGTYRGFLALLKYSMIGITIVLVLMAIFLL